MTGLSLRTKFLLGIMGIAVLLICAVIIFARPALQQKLSTALQKRGISIANNIASNSLNPILTEKYFELEMTLRDFKNSEDDIVYIFVLDNHGKVLAHTFEGGFPLELRDVNRTGPDLRYSVQPIETEKGDILDIAVPLMKGQIGAVHLGIAREFIKGDVNSLLRLIIQLVAAVLAVGAAIGIIFSRIITRPILELTKMAKAVSGGDLAQKATISSLAEIEELGKTFNNMIESRRMAEEALRVSENSLIEAQQIARLGNWEWDIATNVVHWSDELFRIYGYSPGEIAPDYSLIVKTVHPKNREEFLAKIAAALRAESPFEMDYTFFRKDGSTAVLHTIGKVVRDQKGDPIRMVGTVQEITEQKKAEQALRESEEKFRSIFDNANDGIMIAHASTRRIVEANRTICAMLGYSREELTTLGVDQIHPPKDLPHVREEFGKQMRGEKIIAEDMPVQRKDGSVFYADIGASPINLAGQLHAIGIFRDITGRKQAEEEIRAALAEKEILLKEIHHRLKNNLQVVASLLKLQSRHINDKEARILFEESYNRVQTMSLIHERLYASEDLAQIDFRGYVDKLMTNVFALDPGKSEQIGKKLDIEGIFLDVHSAIPCGLIINELVSNALRHAFPDGRRGTITIGMHGDNKGKITFFVRDDGIGFPGGADIGNSKSLGLQLVVSLVRQLNGTIELDKREGTNIKVTFPT